MGRKPIILDKDVVLKSWKANKEGTKTIHQLCEQFSVSRNTLYKNFAHYGLYQPVTKRLAGRPISIPYPDVKVAKDFYGKCGGSPSKFADKFKLKYSTAFYFLVKHNIHEPDSNGFGKLSKRDKERVKRLLVKYGRKRVVAEKLDVPLYTLRRFMRHYDIEHEEMCIGRPRLFNEKAMKEIKELIGKGVSKRKLAKRYKCHVTTIYNVSWAN